MSNKWEIGLEKIQEFQKQTLLKATLLRSELKDWSVWPDALNEGRFVVGWKRITYGYDYRFQCVETIGFKPLSTIKIAHRKVRVWLDKRKLK